MEKYMLGRKAGMTQLFDDSGLLNVAIVYRSNLFFCCNSPTCYRSLYCTHASTGDKAY